MNALPTFKTLNSSSREDKTLKWFPKTSLSLKKDWSFLGVEADDADIKRKTLDADRPALFEQKTLPPNERYSTDNNYSSSDPSPIGSTSRGEADPVEIALPADLLRELSGSKPSQEDEKDLHLGVYNLFSDANMELFYHKGASAIQTSSVGPGRYTSKLINSRNVKKTASDENKENTMTCAFSPVESAVVHLPSSQVVRTFRFKQGPIGLELENINHRVICRTVMPSSQAWAHKAALGGAEIVAINNIKITSLNDFYELLSENRNTGVTLRAIVQLQLQLQLQQSTEQLTSQENTGIDCSETLFSEVASKMSSIQIDDNVNATETVADAIKSIIYRNNDDNLVAAVKVTRSDKEGINEENVPWSYTTAGPQVVEEKEEEKENERTDERRDEKEKEDIGMHVSCMPIDLLQHSKRWGDPHSFLQISNMSTDWRVDVHWIDMDGVFIFRKALNTGDRHAEMTSRHHLWALCASSISNTAGNKNQSKDRLTASSSSGNIFMFRPCASSLQKEKCTSLMWVPCRSLTATQRDTHPFQQLSKSKKESKGSISLEPSMHIQIF